jgi:hypothetical protein
LEQPSDVEPSEAVGSDGYRFPWTFSVHDFEPITGRIPSAAVASEV